MHPVLDQLLVEPSSSVLMRRAEPYSEADFWALTESFPELQLERTAEGEILVMSPVTPQGNLLEGYVFGELYAWNQQAQMGRVFSATVAVRLPSGGLRSPDCAWMSDTAYNSISNLTAERALPVCPEFVVEIRSPSNRLPELQAKMRAYTAAGAVVGWLLDPLRGIFERYTATGSEPEFKLTKGAYLQEPDLLPGFQLLADPFVG